MAVRNQHAKAPLICLLLLAGGAGFAGPPRKVPPREPLPAATSQYSRPPLGHCRQCSRADRVGPWRSAVAARRPGAPRARPPSAALSDPTAGTEAGGISSEEGWRLNVIYDSKCSVCRMEVDFLRSRVAGLRRGGEDDDRKGDDADPIRFTDLESPDGYNSDDPGNGGVTYEDGMRTFVAVRPDGSRLHGVEVFREAYDVVGLGWVFALTRVPLIGKVADAAYKLFARYRTDLTRGAPVEELIDRHYGRNEKRGDDGEECVPCKEKSLSA